MIVKKIKKTKTEKPKAWQIGDLVDYIRFPHNRNPQEKIECAGGRNFLSATHTGQKAEMIALARESVHSHMPVQHWMFSWQEGEQPTREQVEDICGYFKKNHLKLQKATINFEVESDGRFVDREETRKLLLSYPEIQVVSGGYNNLEFTSAGVTKGAGLAFLCEHLNIPLECTMVCGDSENDKDIMGVAGFSVAMGNADPEIKALADYVTDTNEREGVGLAIEKFVNHGR